MAEVKITKKMVVNGVSEFFKDVDPETMVGSVKVADVLAYCENEKNLLEKKASSKSTKNAKENAVIKDMLLEELAKMGKAVTITDLMHTCEKVGSYVLESGDPLTNQKISAIFKPLVADGTLVKTVDKKKSYFSVNLGNDVDTDVDVD